MFDYLKRLFGLEDRVKQSRRISGYTVDPRGVHFHTASHPDSKTNFSTKVDFRDGVYGKDSYDLYNAVHQGKVETGDILEVNAYQETKKYFYQGVDTFKPGTHHFWPEKPYAGMPQSILLGYAEITGWKKIGHYSVDEWNTMMREVNKPAQPQ